MTKDEFKTLPPLLSRADLLALDWSDQFMAVVRYEVRNDKDKVPFGRVGWVRRPAVNGAGENRQGLWRKSDVAWILGPDWQ